MVVTLSLPLPPSFSLSTLIYQYRYVDHTRCMRLKKYALPSNSNAKAKFDFWPNDLFTSIPSNLDLIKIKVKKKRNLWPFTPTLWPFVGSRSFLQQLYFYYPSIHCNSIATQKYSHTYVKYTASIAFHFCSKFVDSFKFWFSVWKKEKYFTRVCCVLNITWNIILSLK